MPGPAMKWGLLALVLVLIVPILLLALLSLTSRRPSNLGLEGGKLQACPDSPNCVCSTGQSAAHRIEPLAWKGDPQAGLERLVQILRQFPNAKCESIQDQRYLHVEFTSALFRFVDDVEFLADPDAGVIHVRSASRAGRSDLGVNRRRVEEIRRQFTAEK